MSLAARIGAGLRFREEVERRPSLQGPRSPRGGVGGGPFVVQVVGRSGSGKTSLIEQAVRRLAARRTSVAVVKHSHHTPDLRGKDTGRFSAAGASLVLFASARSFVSFRGSPLPLIAALPTDVVLVEGYSRRRFGGLRLEVHAPDEVASRLEQILRAVPRRPLPAQLRIDGRTLRAKGPWKFVANLLAAQGVVEVRRPP